MAFNQDRDRNGDALGGPAVATDPTVATDFAKKRGRRRRSFAFILLAAGAMFLLILPTLVSFSGVGRTFVARHFASLGWQAEASDIRIGWITPLSARDLVLVGPSGQTRVVVDQLQCEHTILNAIAGRPMSDLGLVLVNGLHIETAVTDGHSSIEDDLQTLLTPSAGDAATEGLVEIESIELSMLDVQTGRKWTFSGGQGGTTLDGDRIVVDVEGVLSDPRGLGGQMTAAIQIDQNQFVAGEADLESFPLSILDLVTRRLNTFDGQEAHFDGDASGRLSLKNSPDGIRLDTQSVVIRNWQSDVPTIASDGTKRIIHLTNRSASIDGIWTVLPQRIIGEDFRVAADFVAMSGNASLPLDVSASSLADPAQWLQHVDGNLSGTLDLVALDKAVPGIVPLQRGAVLRRAAAEIDLSTAAESGRARLSIRTTPIIGLANDRDVTLAAMTLDADVASSRGRIRADQLRFKSSFGEISGHGELAGGALDFDLRLDQLANTIGSLVDAGRIAPSGIAQGQVRWDNRDEQWTLNGNVSASNFQFRPTTATPAGATGETNFLTDFDTNFSAVGRWDAAGGTLAMLRSASIELKTKNAMLGATLTEPTGDPLGGQPLPIRFAGRGLVDDFYDFIPASIRPADVQVGGEAEFSGFASVARDRVTIGATKLKWIDAVLASGSSRYQQSVIDLNFDGQLQWPENQFVVNNAVLISPSLTAVAQGGGDAGRSELKINVRTELSRLSNVAVAVANGDGVGNQIATPYPMRTVSLQNKWQDNSGASPSGVRLSGGLTGDMAVTVTDGRWNIQHNLTLDQFRVTQAVDSNVAANGGFGAGGFGGGNQRRASPDVQTVWYEPQINFTGAISGDIDPEITADGASIRRFSIDDVDINGQWFQTTIGGSCVVDSAGMDLQCDGPTSIDMSVVASKLSDILQTPVVARGISRHDIRIRMASREQTKFDVAGDLSWESASLAGVEMGPTRLPMHLTESQIRIDDAVVPVGQGQLFLGGVANYRSGRVVIDLKPGRLAQRIELTPQMTGTWLQYLTPVAAGATNLTGTMSAELDGGRIYLDAPAQSQVAGRLSIEQATMTAGQMVDRILVGVDQARTLAGSLRGQPTRATGRTLVTMPPQVVEFSMQNGSVHHDRMYFEIDRAEVVTSGSVSTNGQINLVAQIPIHESWVGRDLGTLAGRPLTLPVTGTLSRINVDTAAVGQMLGQAVIDAGQNEVNRYLENQLGRGLEKLLGR